MKFRAFIDKEMYFFDLKFLLQAYTFCEHRWWTSANLCDCSHHAEPINGVYSKGKPEGVACKKYRKIQEFIKKKKTPDRFTGFKDIKKNDIYENDILSYPDGDLFTVKFNKKDGCWVASFGEWGETSLAYHVLVEKAYVIGNIHQNKELLKNE